MRKHEKDKLRDKRQKNGTLAPVFGPSFDCYREQPRVSIDRAPTPHKENK